MTDEQLRAMARRVISEACDLVRHGCYYAGGEKWRCNGTEDVLADADAVEAAAVAIMREEMANAEAAYEPLWIGPNAAPPQIKVPEPEPWKNTVTCAADLMTRVHSDPAKMPVSRNPLTNEECDRIYHG